MDILQETTFPPLRAAAPSNFKIWPKIQRVRPYNFAASVSSLTKLFQITCREGGVIM